MAASLVLFDYEFSPFSQKIKLLLEASQIPFQRTEQPIALPRPDLERLGITYRRIPVLAIGKDLYCDTDLISNVILGPLKGASRVRTSVHDAAWQAWSVETFSHILMLVQPQLLTDEFKEDRKTIFPILVRPDFASMRPSGLAELRSRMAFIEQNFLADGAGPFFNGGSELSAADIHVIWPIRWALFGLGAKDEKGVGKEAFPRIWRLIQSLPEATGETISGETASQKVLDSGFDPEVTHLEVASDDPLGIAAGTAVAVESIDSDPGTHPQKGDLVGTSLHEVVVQLENGLRLHFPRAGYLVRKA